VLNDADLRARLSAQARLHAQDWTATQMATRVLDFYSTVIACY
jgi:hypothetical protein